MRPRAWVWVLAIGFPGWACSTSRDPPKAIAQESTGAASSPTPGPPALTDLAALAREGESSYSRGEFDSARVFFEAGLTRARAARDSTGEARALTWLGLAAYRQGDYRQARRLGEQALALKLRPGLGADLFRSYNALGLLAADEGRLADALLLHQKAAEVARATADEASLAKSANNRAMVYDAQGKFALAREGYDEARTSARKLGDARIEGRALSNRGALDVRMGNPASAVPALTAALVLLRSVDDRTGEQNTLGQLGAAYDALGEPGLAFAALDDALASARKQGLRLEEASDLELIAGLHRQAGDLQRALQLYDQANRLNGEIGLTAEQGTNRRNAAEIQAALGRADLARDNAVEALRLHRVTGERLQELRDLLLLAELAATQGDSSRVVDAHLRAAEGLGRTLDARIARVEVALTKAAIADRAGQARRVLGALHQAGADLAGGGFGNEWQAAALRARAYARLSLLDSSATAGHEAVAAVERVRSGFGSSFLRTSFAVDKAALYSDLVDVMLRLGRTAEAFEIADGARSHALLEHLAAASDAGPIRATVRSLSEGETILRRIDGLVARLDTLEETPPAQRDATVRARSRTTEMDLSAARSAYEALLIEVAERDASGAALLGGRKTRAEEVQLALAPAEALLEYLVTPLRLIAFVVTHGQVRSVVTEIRQDDLVRRVRLARDLIGEPGSPNQSHGEVLTALHEILVAPVERAGLLKGVTRVIVVPHSVLAYLPFAALKREESGRYMMEDYSLLHLPSAGALAVLRDALPAPVWSGGGPSSTAFAPFPRELPGSVREARAFRRAVPGATSREGAGASEVRLRAALSSGAMVHVATHGLMNLGNPMFSRIELAAGTGAAEDDGRLEVHELLALRIAAPLVFLSGCETGVGASWSTQYARGEDYATLAQGFLYAGARTVAATLWRIGDEGAAAFAEEFYAKLRTLSPDEALVAAQRELLRSARYASPYYWAGYQVLGDSRGWADSHRSATGSVQP